METIILDFGIDISKFKLVAAVSGESEQLYIVVVGEDSESHYGYVFQCQVDGSLVRTLDLSTIFSADTLTSIQPGKSFDIQYDSNLG